MALEWFVASLCCPVCGHLSPEDSSTNMVTKIRGFPQAGYMHVGDNIEVSPELIESGGYLPLKPFQLDEPVHILELWECPFCTSMNWAEIVLFVGIIQSIRTVDLNLSILKKAHFISWRLQYVYETLTGVSLYLDGEPRSNFKELLYQFSRES